MSKVKADPDMAPDATLATDLGDEVKRAAEQLAEMGGERDDIDDFDATGLDDGSDLDYKAPDDDDDKKGDDDDDDKKGDDDDDDKKGDDDDDDDKKGDDDGDEDDSDDDDDDKKGDDDDDDSKKDEDDQDDSDSSDADDDQKPAPKGIPKHRFDQVNERAKAAEKENVRLKAELEAGKPKEKEEDPFDFDVAEKEYLELSLDGDIDAALAKRKEIRSAEKAEWTAETKAETMSETKADAEDAELLSLSQEAEKMFDVFNPESDDFNQAYLNKVLVYYKGYAASGEAANKGDAFVMALADVVEMYDLDDAAASDKDDSKPEPKPTGKKKTGGKKKADAKKNAHTPVAGEGTGSADTGAAVPNIDDMTDEELDALPEKTLARLRGDFI